MSKELKAALCIQNAYRAKQARRVLRKKQGLHDAKNAINGWVTEHDKASGYDYYVNIETGEVTWDKPAEVEAVHKDKLRKKATTKKTRQVARDLKKNSAAITDLFKNDKQRQEFKKLDRIKSEYYSDVKDQDEDAKNWVEVYDSGAEDFYYWNKVTGDVQWTQPHDYILAADDQFLKIILKIQCVFRGKQGRIRAEKKKLGILDEPKEPKKEERELEEWEKWQETTDPNTGDVYYYHIETNEVAWERPLSPAEIEAKEREEKEALIEQQKAEEDRAGRMEEIKEQEKAMFQEAMREAKDKMALRLKRKEEKEKVKQELLQKKADEEKARLAAAVQAEKINEKDALQKKKAKKELHEKSFGCTRASTKSESRSTRSSCRKG